MKLYFTHKTSGSRHETNNYTFTHILGPTYGWYIREGVFTMENIIPVDSDKKSKYGFKDGVLVRGIGSITDEGFGIIEVDEVKLKALSKSIYDLGEKILKQSILEIDMLNTDEAIEWLKKFTDLKEVEKGKFLLKEESQSDMSEDTVPAQYLIIN